MSKSPWGNIGAWAAEAERADEEELQAATAAATAAAQSAANPQKFPSLKDSVVAAGKQKKKNKMTLQEFTMAGSYGSSASSRLTPEEMLRLPTGPKERSGEEMQHGRLGGGFSSYGTRSGTGPPGRIRDDDRRGYGGFDDDRRRGPASSRDSDFEQMPSRADEADNWGSTKRSLPAFNSNTGSGSARPARYADIGGGGGGISRADEADNWGSMKKPLPPPQLRSSSFGSGYRSDSRPGFETDRWTRDSSSNNNNNQEQLKFVPEPSGVKVNKANPFGEARPREEVLTEKGLDWKKIDMEIEGKKVVTSRPTSSQSSRPGSSHSVRSEGLALQGAVEVPAVKPKPRVNPFGDAKPREVLLEEKGLDWKKIDLDLDHRRIDRPETEEEKNLKDEIEQLKKELLQKSDEEQADLRGVILQKEKDLESLTRELDDKVRFGQKPNNDRPGSGSGRYTGPPVRHPSQSGPYEEPRVAEFVDRPRSRGTGIGTGENWSRPNDDRRGFSGGRDGGFSGGRDGGFSGGRDGGFSGGRDGGFSGGRDGGFSGGRDGGFSGGRDGGFAGGRDGGFSRSRDYNSSRSRDSRW